MKNEKNHSQVENLGLNTPSEISVAVGLIDNQINNLKLQNLSNWVGNHAHSSAESREKIEKLKKSKAKLQNFVSKFQGHDSVELKLNIEATVGNGDKTFGYQSDLLAS